MAFTDASLTALRVFREVAERGTLTAAAAALGYTQSAVSRQIASLERAAGTPLLERRHHGRYADAADDLALGEPAGNSGVSKMDNGSCRFPACQQFAKAAARALATGALYLFSLRSVGAAVSNIGPDATAYGDRSANFLVVALGSNDARLDEAWAELRGFFRGRYVSFDTSLGERACCRHCRRWVRSFGATARGRRRPCRAAGSARDAGRPARHLRSCGGPRRSPQPTGRRRSAR
jgi:hypothetical protein